jgi:hypothetical protein
MASKLFPAKRQEFFVAGMFASFPFFQSRLETNVYTQVSPINEIPYAAGFHGKVAGDGN